jgi:hypothetical protein
MVDAAGKLAAAVFLRELERETARKIGGIGGGFDVNSKVLIKLLRTQNYGRLYNEFFQKDGWTGFLITVSPEQFNKAVAGRRKNAETVSEMIDFRFRGLDHNKLNAKQFNISRSEFYRWHEHPNGALSWRTIRSRWKDNRDGAPFLYVNEKFGGLGYPLFDPKRPSTIIADAVHSLKAFRKFVGMSLYVAETIDAGILAELSDLAVPRLRPETTPFIESDLAKMNSYEGKREEMRNS